MGRTDGKLFADCLEQPYGGPRQESDSANRVFQSANDDIQSAKDHIESANEEHESANRLAPLAFMASYGFIWLTWRFARQHMLRRPLRGDQGTSSLDPTQESFAPWTPDTGDDPCEPQGEDFSPSPASLPQPGTLCVPPNGGPPVPAAPTPQ